MDKRVLVADLQARHPPLVHVGVVGAIVGHVDRLPAARSTFAFLIVEDLEPMQVVQVPGDRHVLAVDLEGVQGLVPASVAGRFERRQRAVMEPAHEGAGVVDPDFLDLARQHVLAFFNERLGHGGEVVDRPVEPERGVDAVGEEISRDAGPGRGHIETPKPLTALGQIRLDGPVLQELGPVVEDLAELAFVDQPLRQRHRRHPPVVVPDHVGHAGLLDGLDHLEPLGAVHRQRLLAEDHLLIRRGRQCDLGVRVVRRADIDDVDVLALDELPPIGLDRFVAPLVGKRLGVLGITSTDGLEHGRVLQVKKVAHPAVSVRMSPAHKSVADHADVERFGHERVP